METEQEIARRDEDFQKNVSANSFIRGG